MFSFVLNLFNKIRILQNYKTKTQEFDPSNKIISLDFQKISTSYQLLQFYIKRLI